MNRDLMNQLISKYQAGDQNVALLLEVGVRNAIDLALIRERENEDEDYFQLRQELDEEIDDLLPSIKALGLKRSPIPVGGEWK